MNAAYVAVVDDEAPVRTALGRLLRLAGYDFAAFASGDELLASLAHRRPDCVLLDVHMPGSPGFDVQAQLQATGWRIPVVFITASDEPTLRDAAKRAGGVELLRKPFSNEALIAALQLALGGSSPPSGGGDP